DGLVLLVDHDQRERRAASHVAHAHRVERDVERDRRAPWIRRAVRQLLARRRSGRRHEGAECHLFGDARQPIEESFGANALARLVGEEIPHLLVIALRPRLRVLLRDRIRRRRYRFARRGDGERGVEERDQGAQGLVAGRVALAARIRATAEYAVLVDRDRLRTAGHLGPVADERDLVTIRPVSGTIHAAPNSLNTLSMSETALPSRSTIAM